MTPPNVKDASASKEVNKETEGHPESAKNASGPLGLLFPPDMSVWGEARRLVADKNLRVDDLAACASQDPAIVIELLQTSNAMYFSAGRQPITSTRTAMVRLGSQVIQDHLDQMKERPQIADPTVAHWFEVHRSRCKRISLVARILAESIAKTLSDECQAIGLFLGVGELLAVLHLEHRYVDLTSDLSRNGVNYRLAQDFKFDVEKMGLNYLRRHGIPEALLFAVDREGRSKAPEKAIMKPLCMSASELVDAFDANRWDKFAPGRTVPPKSAIRTLPITESQYLKLYERISEYLFGMRVTEERQKQTNLHHYFTTSKEPASQTIEEKLQSEITTILKEKPSEVVTAKPAVAKPAKEAEEPEKKKATPPTTPAERDEQFSLKKDKAKSDARKKGKSNVITPPKMASKNAGKVVSSVTNVINKAATSEELLSDLLAMLVDNGPFTKSALIVISKDRKLAIVVAARGPNIGNGQQINIEDPLNPLAQCFSKVQSFGNKESKCSPFGSKTFALAPIDADHDTPVALYADCGNDGSITFEARRVFRTVIDILNERLPQIPGGIPVELG